jgi:hypothetical protein
MRLEVLPLSAAAPLLVFLPPLKDAHHTNSGWTYPLECCSERECREIGVGHLEAEPVPSSNGWRLSDGTVIPFHLARRSPDGHFHVCRRTGESVGEIIKPADGPFCLWVPVDG